jgi:hypothetical protein
MIRWCYVGFLSKVTIFSTFSSILQGQSKSTFMMHMGDSSNLLNIRSPETEAGEWYLMPLLIWTRNLRDSRQHRRSACPYPKAQPVSCAVPTSRLFFLLSLGKK